MDGPYQGIDPSNVPQLVYLACQGKEGVDANTYLLLRTALDLDAMHDLLEMKEVQDSWEHAARRNIALAAPR